jgi:hypothetical protein
MSEKRKSGAPTILGGIAAVIVAVSGLVVAVKQNEPTKPAIKHSPTNDSGVTQTVNGNNNVQINGSNNLVRTPEPSLTVSDDFTITQQMSDAPSGNAERDLESTLVIVPGTRTPSFPTSTCDDSPFVIFNGSNKTQIVVIVEWATDNEAQIGLAPGQRWVGQLNPAIYVIHDDEERWGDAFEISHCQN